MPATPTSRHQPDGPLLVFGPRSTTYDFGPGHPLTPRRFGPGIDLLQAVGAAPGLEPQPATDDELRSIHSAGYVAAVRRLSLDPDGRPGAGIGPGDTPPFRGMHDAGAAVAGGSLRAIEAIVAGSVLHAFHPGGGLHHAMADRASGFCIYNDVALAIQRARSVGLRVLYLDFDVHHGDGVEAIHGPDPGVLTFSIHESGQTLFPGSGFIADDAPGAGAGTVVNVPLDAGTGADPWLAAVERLVPELAAAYGPDVVVSQHGCDGHAWDPLANLRLTTSAMGAAARLVDGIAHRHAAGRWLATGGGGYDAYGVVPRAWSLVWLAGAHRPVPGPLPQSWRQRWAAEAARYRREPLPADFEDNPEVGRSAGWLPDAAGRARELVDLVRVVAVPALIQAAVDRGWWVPASSDDPPGGERPAAGGQASRDTAAADGPSLGIAPGVALQNAPGVAPEIVPAISSNAWAGLRLQARVAGPLDAMAGHRLVARALTSAAEDLPIVTAAVAGGSVIGLAISIREPQRDVRRLLALGVAPASRRRGLASAILAAHVGELDRQRELGGVEATVTRAERDVVDPLPGELRASIARRLLGAAGFRVDRAGGAIGLADRLALQATRRP